MILFVWRCCYGNVHKQYLAETTIMMDCIDSELLMLVPAPKFQVSAVDLEIQTSPDWHHSDMH